MVSVEEPRKESDSQQIVLSRNLRDLPLVTDFCTELRGSSVLSSEKDEATSEAYILATNTFCIPKLKLRSWIQLSIFLLISMVALVLVWLLFCPPEGSVALESSNFPVFPESITATGVPTADLTTVGNEFRSLNQENGENLTRIDPDVASVFLHYLHDFLRSPRQDSFDYYDDNRDDNSTVSSEDNSKPASLELTTVANETVPDPEALRGKYLAYIPVVLSDDSEEDDDSDEDRYLRSDPVMPRRPAESFNRYRTSVPKMTVNDVKWRRQELLKNIVAMQAQQHQRRAAVRAPPPQEFSPAMPRRRFPNPGMRWAPSQQVRHYEMMEPKRNPMPNQRKEPQHRRVSSVYFDGTNSHGDRINPTEQSQVHQFTSIQDIIGHNNDRSRQPPSQTRQRYTSTAYKSPSSEPKSSQSRNSGKPYSFMLDLYPIRGGSNRGIGGDVDETRLSEERERDQRYNGYRRPGSNRFEDEQEDKDMLDQVNLYQKSQRGRNQGSTYSEFEPNSYRTTAKKKPQADSDSPKFTVEDILRALKIVAMSASGSERRSSILPKLPDDVIQSRMEADKSFSYKKMALPSRQNDNYYGYVNIENHAAEPLPDPESLVIPPASI